MIEARCQMTVDVINDYVDGTLEPSQRGAVEAHLASCAHCRALADDLRRIVSAASALPTMAPNPVVWHRLSQRVQNSSGPIYGWMSRAAVPLALAAVLFLAVVVGQRIWRPPQSHAEPTAAANASAPATGSESKAKLVQSVESELKLAEEHYEKAIAGLEAIANAQQKTLDPKLAATLQKNLAVIDQAIGESRAALRAQPDSRPAQESLFEAFRSKVALLQNTVSLINEMRKGNDSEAARIVGQLAR
jgi:hypothetical protein